MDDKARKYAIMEKALDEWYSEDQSRRNILNGILSGKTGVSLRTIDWFTTNMSARSSVVFVHSDTGKVVDVNGFYKDSLKCFHKKGFDPFKRRGADPLEAPLRQKNFFKWAIENGIIDYVIRNITSIEHDMARAKSVKRVTSCDRRSGKGGEKRRITMEEGEDDEAKTTTTGRKKQRHCFLTKRSLRRYPSAAAVFPQLDVFHPPSAAAIVSSPQSFVVTSNAAFDPFPSSPPNFYRKTSPSMFITSQKTTLEIPKFVKLDW